jgi:alpha-mannosidase
MMKWVQLSTYFQSDQPNSLSNSGIREFVSDKLAQRPINQVSLQVSSSSPSSLATAWHSFNLLMLTRTRETNLTRRMKRKREKLNTWRIAFAFSKIALTLLLAVGPEKRVGFAVAVRLRVNDCSGTTKNKGKTPEC